MTKNKTKKQSRQNKIWQTENQQKLQLPRNKPYENRFRAYRYWSYLWGVLGPFLTLFSLYHAFYPYITPLTGNQLDLKNPFSIPFTITNNNTYPIRNVQIIFKLEHVVALSTNGGKVIFNQSILIRDPPIPVLEPKNSITSFADLNKFVNVSKIQEATISLDITYYPFWLYPKQHFNQPYKAYITEGGSIYWSSTNKQSS